MFDVRQLRVLREVAARGSFSAAAEALDYTQSAVSKQIAALERDSGAALVERAVRPLRLTPSGAALAAHAEVVLGRMAAARDELEAIAMLRAGELDVAVIHHYPALDPAPGPELSCALLGEDAFALVLPPEHERQALACIAT
jgi:DNA-binding transcriptional LysR family regulator